MLATIIALVIMFFIGRAVLKWARKESKERTEALEVIINYLKEDKSEDEGRGEGDS